MMPEPSRPHLSDPAGRELLVRTVTGRWDGLDILVNNAGTNIRKPCGDDGGGTREGAGTEPDRPTELARSLTDTYGTERVQRW